MRIVILGGTGLIGRHLEQAFTEQWHQVSCLGRSAFQNSAELIQHLEGADVLINLAGANIGQRWSAGYEKTLWQSRVDTTQTLATLLTQISNPPTRIISASAIGYYPQSDCAHPMDETSEAGDGFLSDLSLAWEDSAKALSEQVLIFRFGVVLSNQGGALNKMLPAFKLGLGGPVAGGEQCFSWIHIDDLVNGFLFALATPHMQGCYNLTSPNPVPQKVFGRTLAHCLGRPFWLPLPEWQLKLMFGRGAQVLTASHAVIPTKLKSMGFEFRYPSIEQALGQLFPT